MIHDISNTGASVVQIEKNSTCESIAAELPPQSFRITVVGGYRDSIAQCIHDNKIISRPAFDHFGTRLE
jgi:hypothetical protein